MGDILFTSTLDLSYRAALERLFFFNANQMAVSDSILSAIDRYGAPRVAEIHGRLWVTLDSGVEAQSLFVLEQVGATPELAGAVVYTRDGDALIVLFVAVREDYSARGDKAHRMLFFRIMDEVRKVASRVKGIVSITLFLRELAPTRVSVRALQRMVESQLLPPRSHPG